MKSSTLVVVPGASTGAPRLRRKGLWADAVAIALLGAVLASTFEFNAMRFLARSAVVAGFVVINAAYAVQAVPQPMSALESVKYVGYSMGEIKKIDTDQGTVTLLHGPIENLGMPGMTMVFRLAKPEQAAAFKVGELVRFKAERIKGSLVITELMSVK